MPSKQFPHLTLVARLSEGLKDIATSRAIRSLEDAHNALLTQMSKTQVVGKVDLVKAGPVTDNDFGKVAPVDGSLALDTTNNKLYVRVAGVWKSVVVT